MSILVSAAGMSVLMVMVITVCSCRDQFSLQIRFNCLIRIAFGAGYQLNSRVCKCLLGSSADASADQYVHRPIGQQPGESPVSDTV